ncbi:RNA-binding, CRM domain [Dillenia turbinata]|uniref:RNA-binding, CRM domain n=1 Tax=Dillenia turbinata TaxID=194707 RepID=A0AAN8V5Q9_9MAGN
MIGLCSSSSSRGLVRCISSFIQSYPLAKRKEAWLIEKLRKFEVPKAPPETYDPEILTEEEKFYLKRKGERKKNYVPVGRQVVLNMHLHWKKHETVKVVCKPCKPGQIHEYAAELARLSKGIIIDIKPDKTVIFYHGKNVQPEVMYPSDTLSKSKKDKEFICYSFTKSELTLDEVSDR